MYGFSILTYLYGSKHLSAILRSVCNIILNLLEFLFLTYFFYVCVCVCVCVFPLSLPSNGSVKISLSLLGNGSI
jgi:hypothetical protein